MDTRIFGLLSVIILSLILGFNEGFCGTGPSGQPVVELGLVGISPWGSCPDFRDRTAKWIWTTLKGTSSVPSNKTVTFAKTYENTQQSNIQITINIVVDNGATVRLNGSTIGTAAGGWGGGATNLRGTLKPGTNLLEIDATNWGSVNNPAGLVASVFMDNTPTVLFHTDSLWTWTGDPG